METKVEQSTQWFVMRDLKRPNAKTRAYQQLADEGFRVFTPMTTKIVDAFGKRRRIQVPFVPDLLFVNADKDLLDQIVRKVDTLQYRYVKGAPYCTPMTVPDNDMERFITAVACVKTPKFYTPQEITSNMLGLHVRIINDGPLNGFEGRLLKVKGSGKKRLLVELPGVLAAAIEVAPDFIHLFPKEL